MISDDKVATIAYTLSGNFFIRPELHERSKWFSCHLYFWKRHQIDGCYSLLIVLRLIIHDSIVFGLFASRYSN